MNRTLLITGASSALGREFINTFHNEYDMVYAHYNTSNDVVDELAQKYSNVIPIRADFSDEKSVDGFIANLNEFEKKPTHFIHMVSEKINYKKFHQYQIDEYTKHYEISVLSAVRISQSIIGAMQKNGGRIVFVLSSFVSNVPPKYQSPYIVTKYALLGLMKNLAAEYASKGVFTNAVSPDMMETKLLDNLPDAVVKLNAESNMMGRNIEPREVISTIQFLLSDSHVINGQNITVGG